MLEPFEEIPIECWYIIFNATLGNFQDNLKVTKKNSKENTKKF